MRLQVAQLPAAGVGMVYYPPTLRHGLSARREQRTSLGQSSGRVFSSFTVPMRALRNAAHSLAALGGKQAPLGCERGWRGKRGCSRRLLARKSQCRSADRCFAAHHSRHPCYPDRHGKSRALVCLAAPHGLICNPWSTFACSEQHRCLLKWPPLPPREWCAARTARPTVSGGFASSR